MAHIKASVATTRLSRWRGSTLGLDGPETNSEPGSAHAVHVAGSSGMSAHRGELDKIARACGIVLLRDHDVHTKLAASVGLRVTFSAGFTPIRQGTPRARHCGGHYACGPWYSRSHGLHQDHRHSCNYRTLHSLSACLGVCPLWLFAPSCC